MSALPWGALMSGGAGGAPCDRRLATRRKWAISVFAVLLTLAAAEIVFRVFAIDRQLEYEFDEELYWRLKPHQVGHLWMGGGTFRSPRIRVFHEGFRAHGYIDVGSSFQDPPEALFLGDSYTFGLGVEDMETFSSRLVDKLSRFGFTPRNGGGPGYGVFQSKALLERELKAGRIPDVVILTIPTGDVLRQPFSDAAFEEYRATQKRRKRLRDVSRVATFVYRRLIHLKRRKAEAPRAVPNERSAKAVETFRELWAADAQRIREMKALCDKHNAAFIALHWPQPSGAGWNEIVESGLESLVEETGLIALTELDERFAGRGSAELTIPGDGHPSVLAHELVADYLAEELAPLLRKKGFQDSADER